ncbi:hypothetical protein A0U92_02190 [Acetobacter aceti]|uniref:Uncharacterized protein n=1 Tax=Acetobacter aceti TaxID=435 RepID=A0A1U9KDB7_ACEAC|nr:hypothetical protein A0U92_02190 [Acetobacter aceti]
MTNSRAEWTELESIAGLTSPPLAPKASIWLIALSLCPSVPLSLCPSVPWEPSDYLIAINNMSSGMPPVTKKDDKLSHFYIFPRPARNVVDEAKAKDGA